MEQNAVSDDGNCDAKEKLEKNLYISLDRSALEKEEKL
jgi:hypothetical protein